MPLEYSKNARKACTLEATEVAALTESVVQGKRLRDTEDDAIDGLLGKAGLRPS